MTKSIDVTRFLTAQAGTASADRSRNAFQVALEEILNGAKTGHWIWYVFPQGPFGTSDMAQEYAIKSPSEAIAFLQHPVLRNRLLEITKSVANQLNSGVHPETLMNGKIDCQKLTSSMTLFEFAADELNDRELSSVTKNVLSQVAIHGWKKCAKTLDWLKDF